jgi:hypothetical protein
MGLLPYFRHKNPSSGILLVSPAMSLWMTGSGMGGTSLLVRFLPQISHASNQVQSNLKKCEQPLILSITNHRLSSAWGSTQPLTTYLNLNKKAGENQPGVNWYLSRLERFGRFFGLDGLTAFTADLMGAEISTGSWVEGTIGASRIGKPTPPSLAVGLYHREMDDH